MKVVKEMKKGKPRGFATMTPERRQEVARKGGRSAHEMGVAHEFTREEAVEAGRRGGAASRGGGRKKKVEAG